MRKEFQSRHFSSSNIDYIDEIPVPEPKRQNDDSKRENVKPAPAEETGPPSKKSKE